MRKKLFYSIYGLQISSNEKIPGLRPNNAPGRQTDIAVNLGFIPYEISVHLSQSKTVYHFEPGYEEKDPPHLIVHTLANGKYFHFCYDDRITFIFDRDATTVSGVWQHPLELEDAALYLLGPILGFMLRLRGITCLHAGGVVVKGKALALLGPSGVGKSTLTASFAAAGYPVLTDDIMVLRIEDRVIQAAPGYGRIRLYPDSFKNLEELPTELPRLTPNWEKCYLDLHSSTFKFNCNSVSLGTIYILDWSKIYPDTSEIMPLSPASAVPLLAVNTYRSELLDSSMRSEEFFFLTRLASQIKIKKVHPVDNISKIPQLRQSILDDFFSEQ